MNALDYFLYDNQTWSALSGRDWGLKAATGILATRVDLKSDFSRYCGTTPGERNRLDGFGEALGGFRPGIGTGYMLCVTLESSDPYGRPAWAVVGLWCPGHAVLRNVLTGDLIGAAKDVLRAPSPPPAISVKGGFSTEHASRRTSTGTTFHHFASGATVREVSSILLGAIQSGTVLPNVLGITGKSPLPALAQAGFDRVYCCPMDESAERVLARQLSPPDLQDLEIGPLAVETKVLVSDARPAYRLEASPQGFFWPAVWTVSVVAAILALSLSDVVHDLRVRNSAAPVRHPSVSTDVLSAAPSVAQTDRGPEVALDGIRRSLEEFRALDPNALRNSRGFRIAATVAVIPEQHDEDRLRVQAAYETLLEVRERMIKRPNTYVAYYYEPPTTGPGKLSATTRLTKIVRILKEKPLGQEACNSLRYAFLFEFEPRNSEVRRWCEASLRLETALESAPKMPK
jgi:hypothetical protein